jgi:hypothetical protein
MTCFGGKGFYFGEEEFSFLLLSFGEKRGARNRRPEQNKRNCF